jgi:hypothetical protein
MSAGRYADVIVLSRKARNIIEYQAGRNILRCGRSEQSAVDQSCSKGDLQNICNTVDVKSIHQRRTI